MVSNFDFNIPGSDIPSVHNNISNLNVRKLLKFIRVIYSKNTIISLYQ